MSKRDIKSNRIKFDLGHFVSNTSRRNTFLTNILIIFQDSLKQFELQSNIYNRFINVTNVNELTLPLVLNPMYRVVYNAYIQIALKLDFVRIFLSNIHEHGQKGVSFNTLAYLVVFAVVQPLVCVPL